MNMMHAMGLVQRQHVRFDALVEGMEGTTSLVLLRQIDGTVDALQGFCKSFLSLTSNAETLAADVAASKVAAGCYLEKDPTAAQRLSVSLGKLDKAIGELRSRKRSIDRDSELKRPHRERLHDAYDEAISKATHLIEACNTLVLAVREHDRKARLLAPLPHNTREASRENMRKILESDAFTVEHAYEDLVASRGR